MREPDKSMRINWLCKILTIALPALAIALSLGPAATAHAQSSEYVLGPGDVLRITVFQNNDLTTEARVSESGAISFPLIGVVPVKGASASEVEQVIATRLREGGFVNRPQVNAQIMQFKSLQVSVLGQVNRPGKYPLEQSRNRLSEVLAVAGGVTTLGSDVVTVISTQSGMEIKTNVDIAAMYEAGDLSKDIQINSGDVIYVPRYPVFYIYGEVNRPGQYRLERGMTVQQALAAGGGLTLRGTERGLRVNRRDASGKVAPIETRAADSVLADDVLFVKESIF